MLQKKFQKHLLASILAIGAAGSICLADSPIACNLNALTQVERSRNQQLSKQWQSAVLDRRELDDGYAFHIDASKIALCDLAEWIALEHRCCPFFRFRLEVDEHDVVWMTLTGGRGVKEFVASNAR
jgi:hypothetical protein